MVHKEILMHPA